jgi:hypothetical protein
MDTHSYLRERLTCLFLLGIVLLQYPILALANSAATAAGIPVLFIYLFVTWAVFIALMAIMMEFAKIEENNTEGDHYDL